MIDINVYICIYIYNRHQSYTSTYMGHDSLLMHIYVTRPESAEGHNTLYAWYARGLERGTRGVHLCICDLTRV